MGWDGRRKDKRTLTFFTFATGAVPGLPQGGTAVRLQRGPVDVDLAAVIDNLKPAGALDRLCVSQRDVVCNSNPYLANILVCEYKQVHCDSPMHSRPELSRELPIEHKHTNDPWLFLHSPLMQGLDEHSSRSGETETSACRSETLEACGGPRGPTTHPRRRPSWD